MTASTAELWRSDAKKEDCSLYDGDLSRTDLSLFAAGCLVERCSFSGASLPHAALRDVRFVGCDFSNADLRRAKLRRVEFIDCRMTGLKSLEAEWVETLIENCECSYLQLTDSKMPVSELRGCSLADADFRGVSLKDSTFERCNLARVDLTRATLTDTDFRGAEIDGITLRAGDLNGAIVSAAQAIELARFFGVKVR